MTAAPFPADVAFAVDRGPDRGIVVVCGATDPVEMHLVQEKLRESGHVVIPADELDDCGDLIERMWARERHEVYVCEAPPRMLDCVKLRDPDFKPMRNRIRPRRMLEPVTAEDHAAVAAAQGRQARRNAKRAKLATP